VSSLDLPVSFVTADRSFVSSSAPSFLFGGLLHVSPFCSCVGGDLGVLFVLSFLFCCSDHLGNGVIWGFR
jgi:hypothetical protein